MHVIQYLLDMSSIESCREQKWWNQVHRASGSERPVPSRAKNPSERILTVAALLIHVSAGGCLANGCAYTHSRTHARQQACTSVLIQDDISTQHHTHTEEDPTPLHGHFLVCAKSISPHCFVLIWPPSLFLFSHSLTCLHFFCLSMFFKNKWMLCKSCVIAMFTQRGQEDGKSYLAHKDGGEVQTRAVMPDTFRSIAKCRVRETRTVKISQTVLSWALQEDSRDTHVNHHQSRQTENMFIFLLALCQKKVFTSEADIS